MAEPYYQDSAVTVHHGDCLDILPTLPDESIDAVVTDPPYALGFMGRKWDTFAGEDIGRGAQARTQRAAEVTPQGAGHSTSAGPYLASGVDSLRAAGAPFQSWCEQWARECLRVLKPGGHIVAFGGTRTWHRLACAIEDAGFEIRDSLAWLYGSGFPKSLDVSKAIDKAAGVDREAAGPRQSVANHNLPGTGARFRNLDELGGERIEVPTTTTPATDAAKRWQGYGTALKPAFEPIVLARKPIRGTVAANVQEWGTGALNIDATRIAHNEPIRTVKPQQNYAEFYGQGGRHEETTELKESGRWPANVVLDDSQAAALDAQSGTLTSGVGRVGAGKGCAENASGIASTGIIASSYGDSGGASRFFYTSKAPQHERPTVDGVSHPTVKPLDVMRWLVRLVTPPRGKVLDPFTGTGTTAEACIHEHKNAIVIEREDEYLPLILARLRKPMEVGFDFEEGA